MEDPPLPDDVDHREDEPAGDSNRIDRLQEFLLRMKVQPKILTELESRIYSLPNWLPKFLSIPKPVASKLELPIHSC